MGAGVRSFFLKRLAQRLGRSYLPLDGRFEPFAADGASIGDCAPATAVSRLAALRQMVK